MRAAPDILSSIGTVDQHVCCTIPTRRRREGRCRLGANRVGIAAIPADLPFNEVAVGGHPARRSGGRSFVLVGGHDAQVGRDRGRIGIRAGSAARRCRGGGFGGGLMVCREGPEGGRGGKGGG